MDDIIKFESEKKQSAEEMHQDQTLIKYSVYWIKETSKYNYSYNFTWMGMPIIQYPQDILAMQEIIWKVKPDLVIEMGIARGGSLIYYASLLELIGGEGEVLGVDIDIREHNRKRIEAHPMFKRIKILEGSSVDESTVKKVYDIAETKKNIMVILDSNHTHNHVLEELEAYSPLVSRDSYLVVFDTIIEDMPTGFFDRPWDKGNNPKTAVYEFLKKNKRFIMDKDIENKLLITVAPDGYLKCIEDARK